MRRERKSYRRGERERERAGEDWRRRRRREKSIEEVEETEIYRGLGGGRLLLITNT